MIYVALAYGITAVVIGGYVWSVERRRRAVRRELEALTMSADGASAPSERPEAPSSDASGGRAQPGTPD